MGDEWGAFLAHDPWTPLTASQYEMVVRGVDVWEDNPEIYRGRDPFGRVGAMLSMDIRGVLLLNLGHDLSDLAAEDQRIIANDLLGDEGFGLYHLLALGEIVSHSRTLEVMRKRLEDYRVSGQRMATRDDYG